MKPEANQACVPRITVRQMREVDQMMVEDYGIDLVRMMENAGRHCAEVSRMRFLGGSVRGARVLVAAGTGGNGGGVLAAARNLHNWGAEITVWTTRPFDTYPGIDGEQLRILAMLGVNLQTFEPGRKPGPVHCVLDGIIGYSLSGTPRGVAARMIAAIMSPAIPVLSLDVPSGIDADTATAYTPAVRPAATLTLALPKAAMAGERARKLMGELYLADIGVPPGLYRRLDPPVSVDKLFDTRQILRLW